MHVHRDTPLPHYHHRGPPRPHRPPGRYVKAVLPWLAAAYLATGIYSIQPNEQAVVRRCGRALPEMWGPGLHVGLPYGIDRVTRVKMGELKRVGVGVGLADRALGRVGEPRESEGLTGDRNLVLIAAVVQYRILDARSYLFKVGSVPGLIENVTGDALSSIITAMNVDDILTVERIAVQNRVRLLGQAALDRYGAGVQIMSVSLEGVTPPQEVAPAFRDVTSAREDRERTINEALGYAGRLLPQTRGEAQRIVVDAEAAREEFIRKARGDADRFRKMAAEASDARELTMRRLILETMEEVLPRLKKIVVGADAGRDLDLGLIESQQKGPGQ
ncbi:MAG: FtsH protease activity modulator HflK [Planctomycetes bacterium]|nr:FtsH protease activity modulator HflK [Planctomycetota bacterium]